MLPGLHTFNSTAKDAHLLPPSEAIRVPQTASYSCPPLQYSSIVHALQHVLETTQYALEVSYLFNAVRNDTKMVTMATSHLPQFLSNKFHDQSSIDTVCPCIA